ncbi:hypothetical protein P43SY_012049 [Pythium insidiosum]|uniref:Carbohydrate-binding protein n=1 Tax=Pythium insidiosum TaxID=114742 RepID=A0AAD5Q594_PYTIN|nr:hypothetical protein P43SY_012049 [Pythium insidiosum]
MKLLLGPLLLSSLILAQVADAAGCTQIGGSCIDANGKPSRCTFGGQDGTTLMCALAPAPCPADMKSLQACAAGRICAPFNGQRGLYCMTGDFYENVMLTDACYQKANGEKCDNFFIRTDSAGVGSLYTLTESNCVDGECSMFPYQVCMNKKIGDECSFRHIEAGGVQYMYKGTCVQKVNEPLQCVEKLKKNEGPAPKLDKWPASVDLSKVKAANTSRTATPSRPNNSGSAGSTSVDVKPKNNTADATPKSDKTPDATPKSAAHAQVATGVAALVVGLTAMMA